MNVDTILASMDRVNRDLRREKFNATCPHCGADILNALEESAYDWGGYGPPGSTLFECPKCEAELEFYLDWATVLEKAEFKRK